MTKTPYAAARHRKRQAEGISVNLGRGLSRLLCLGACWLLGCEQAGPRVYSAMPFDTELQCLRDYVPLGLVEAEDLPASCDPVCLTRDDTLYVSQVCAPYPAEASLVTPEVSSDCAAALASLQDGGSCDPEPP